MSDLFAGLPADAADFALLKPLAPEPFGGTGELALFVTHAPAGVLKPHVAPYLAALDEAGVAVLLIVAADRPVDVADEVLALTAATMVRRNAGYDFAAWAHALKLHPEAWGASTLYLVNDSLFGPSTPAAFARLVARVRASDADLVGLTESHERGWHVQSYFLALRQALLATGTVQGFFAGVVNLADKDAVIQTYEVRLAALAEQTGHRVEVLFPSPAAMNPALFDWRGLLAAGFPFVKLLLLRGDFPFVDTTGWREALVAAGFDMGLVEATLAAAAQAALMPPAAPAGLLAHPWKPPSRPAGPLKVAFHGPWNYDNGLGFAARNLIAALRRTGVRLSLHGIEKPFHIHRPLGPAGAIADFAGPADIAIVCMNPDSWFLLTDAQRTAIRAARRRIGCWVWEMGHIPDAWWADFGSVDRVWAPSGYCAALFAEQGEAPVDILPYPVPLPPKPEQDAGERDDVLAGLGLDPGRRLILYVFDGSSYLIRKNPAALIRAFAASGLGAEGWTLALKTKYLMDRPAEGEALAALAEATDDVLLIDRPVTPPALEALMKAADLYASPHCSEGFGLTVAEAMALGKPVVATDFGGTTEFLDTGCGWPVKAREWTLDEDHGHYTKGGSWARIDEPALAATLRRAAEAVAAGDDRIGRAARARIGERLSFDAIAGRMMASFAALEAETEGRFPTIAYAGVRPGAAPTFAEAELGPTVTKVALDAAGHVPALFDPLPESRDHWIVFAPADALVSAYLPQGIADYTAGRPDIAILHGDDVAHLVDHPIDRIRRKPLFDPVLLAAQDYIGTPVIVRAEALARIGPPCPELGAAALDEMLFRAHGLGLSIERIPNILIAHPGRRPAAPVAERQAMLAGVPALAGHDIVAGRAPGTLTLRRRFDGREPAVTIVVPTQRTTCPDGVAHVACLLDALEGVDWPADRLTVLVGDDVDTAQPPDWAVAPRPFRLDRVATPRSPGERFNYAAKMNLLWRQARTEHIVFVNDDVTPCGAGWLKALMTFAVEADVGGVGARLLHPDGRLQHAGLAPLFDGVAHVFARLKPGRHSYRDWALVHRQWSMVTGAVFATRRAAMEQVDGFDEGFSLEYNDVDLCLRMRSMGLRIVYAADAELIHVEKASRGEAPPPAEDMVRFAARWRDWLAADPAFHPYTHRHRFDLAPGPDPETWYA